MKSEPLEAALGVDPEESPAPAEPEDVLDHEQMEVTSQDTGDAGEQVASTVGGSFTRPPPDAQMRNDFSCHDGKPQKSPHGLRLVGGKSW